MKIVITGTKGLAVSLQQEFATHQVCLVGRSNDHDVNRVQSWGDQFLDHDILINCAYDAWAQIQVLEFFHSHWKHDATKCIVSVGSRVVNHSGLDGKTGYWPYRMHKQALQLAHDAMQCDSLCRMLLVNPGPIDTDMVRHHAVPKMMPAMLAHKIKEAILDPTVRRLDVWI